MQRIIIASSFAALFKALDAGAEPGWAACVFCLRAATWSLRPVYHIPLPTMRCASAAQRQNRLGQDPYAQPRHEAQLRLMTLRLLMRSELLSGRPSINRQASLVRQPGHCQPVVCVHLESAESPRSFLSKLVTSYQKKGPARKYMSWLCRGSSAVSLSPSLSDAGLLLPLLLVCLLGSSKAEPVVVNPGRRGPVT